MPFAHGAAEMNSREKQPTSWFRCISLHFFLRAKFFLAECPYAYWVLYKPFFPKTTSQAQKIVQKGRFEVYCETEKDIFYATFCKNVPFYNQTPIYVGKKFVFISGAMAAII